MGALEYVQYEKEEINSDLNLKGEIGVGYVKKQWAVLRKNKIGRVIKKT